MSGNDDLAALYREAVLVNAADPCGYGEDIEHTHRAEGHNPVCGDSVDMRFRVADGRIEAAAFHGESCAICKASASLLCRHLPGQPVAAVEQGRDGFAASIRTGETAACPDFLEPLVRVRRYPARVECAMLPWDTAVRTISGKPGN